MSQLTFKADPSDTVESLLQGQFVNKWAFAREMVQNSVDAGSTLIVFGCRYLVDKHQLMCSIRDDGVGMSLDIINKNYLRLFASSKEHGSRNIGYFSLGRLSMFALNPERVILYTKMKGLPAHKLTIIGNDLSLTLDELSTDDQRMCFDVEFGTWLEIIMPCNNINDFISYNTMIISELEQSCRFVTPTLQASKYTLLEKELREEILTINRPLAFHEEFFPERTMKIEGCEHSLTYSIGFELPDNRDRPGFSISKGGIIISNTPFAWTGSEPFWFQGLKFIIQSFQFETNISRNQVLTNTDIMRSIINTIFNRIILKTLSHGALLLTRPEARYSTIGGINNSIRLSIMCALVYHKKYRFALPPEIYDAPLVATYSMNRWYSVNELVEMKREGIVIYHTPYYDRPTFTDQKDRPIEKTKAILISTYDLSEEFKNEYLPDLLGSSYRERKSNSIVDFESSDVRQYNLTFDSKFREIASIIKVYKKETVPARIMYGRVLEFVGDITRAKDDKIFTTDKEIIVNLNSMYVGKLMKLYHDTHYKQIATALICFTILSEISLPPHLMERAYYDFIHSELGSTSESKILRDLMRDFRNNME